MKPDFNHLSHSLLLGSSLIVGSLASVSANDNFEEQQIAMVQPASSLASHFSTTKLSAEKMLEMANKLNMEQMNSTQEKLEFALIYSAANKGLAEAQFRLANYYINNKLVSADEDKALYWLTQAINQDHQGAIFVYENLYEDFIDIGC